MTSFVALVSVVVDGVVATATVTSSACVLLLRNLVLVLLLLAVVEFLRCVLRCVVQLAVVAISICLALVVYVSAVFIHVAAIMLSDPLEKAVAWQRKAMRWMNSFLPPADC